MNERKKHRIPDYEYTTPDDIRTIPDFYDNLYPSFDNFISGSIINARPDSLKKKEKTKNNEKK